MSEDCKIEQLFNQSIKAKQACIEHGFKQLYRMSEYITQSIQNGDGNSSKRIVNIMRNISLDKKLLNKELTY